MNSFLLNRQLGQISPQALSAAQNQRQFSALQIARNERFAWKGDNNTASGAENGGNAAVRNELSSKAHAAGVNAITIDRFEGR